LPARSAAPTSARQPRGPDPLDPHRLWPLGDDVTFVPGHGPVSTFGEERRNNPFVADHLIDAA
jgi:hypothetical protein